MAETETPDYALLKNGSFQNSGACYGYTRMKDYLFWICSITSFLNPGLLPEQGLTIKIGSMLLNDTIYLLNFINVSI
jgi:hypothetical protein